MEEEQAKAMLRHFISHFHQLSQLYGSHTSTPSLPHSRSVYFRWCVLDLDENPREETCNNVVVTAGKPESFKMPDPYKPPPSKRSRKDRSRKNLGSMDSSEIMEQEIWKELPEDLLEAVIARLPISAFFRFRSVCRKWNSLLASRSFSEHCAQLPKPRPWFYTITHENVNTAAIYDPSMKKWRHPAIPSLPPNKVILLPVASAGGLICFLDIGHRYFYICNPLTHSWKELPARSVKVWSRIAVGMTQNGKSAAEGYKILWVGRDGEYEIYDSLKNSWSRPGNLPSSIRLPLSLNFRSHTVSIGSSVYFMRSDPEGIVSYDMGSRVWKEYLIPSPPNSTDHYLAECGGRVYLVGLLTKNAATCVCVWELQKMMLLWKEVDRMPNVWCLEFYGKHVRMTCLGNKGLLMLSLRSRQMNRIVTYDVATREWLKVPACVLPRGRKRQWIACGAAFYPCLISAP